MTKRKTGLSLLVIGPPGSGKSEFAASVAETGAKAKLLALRAKEIDSAGYLKHGINEGAELFHDPGWIPSIGEFEATAFVDFLRRLRELQSDTEYDAIIIDPITDLNEIIGHALLAPEKAADPSEVENSRAYWGNVRKRMIEAIKAMSYLSYAEKPKHVIAVVHARPASEDEESKVREVKYLGKILAMLEGSIRYDVAGEFQCTLFTDLRVKRVNTGTATKPKFETERDYGLLVQPSNERFAKTNSYLTEARIPNNFSALLEAMGNGS